MVFELCERTDKQIDEQTYSSQYFAPFSGRSKTRREPTYTDDQPNPCICDVISVISFFLFRHSSVCGSRYSLYTQNISCRIVNANGNQRQYFWRSFEESSPRKLKVWLPAVQRRRVNGGLAYDKRRYWHVCRLLVRPPSHHWRRISRRFRHLRLRINYTTNLSGRSASFPAAIVVYLQPATRLQTCCP